MADPAVPTSVPAVADPAVPTSVPAVADPAVPTSVPSVYTPLREYLQDQRAVELLQQSAVNWRTAPQAGSKLAVLGIDARGSQLQAASFDQEWHTLHKMLAAIGCDLNQCAVGGLHWQAEPAGVFAPFALLLVDSGEDQAALIQHWRGKTLQFQGATAVTAPHPRMFTQGAVMKRQAWNSLQMLQKFWTA